MDQEIASLKLNINQLAGITGVHRQTVAARLKNVAPAAGSNSKLKLYLVNDILSELMIPTVSTANVEEMEPADRLAHWKAENERLKFEVDTKQLIPAEDVAREFSLMAKAVGIEPCRDADCPCGGTTRPQVAEDRQLDDALKETFPASDPISP